MKKATILIVFINTLVFFAWRIPSLQNVMHKYFLLSPASGINSQMFLSTFSHLQLFHILFNMIALYSMSDLISKILPVEQFVAYYLSSGVFASFMSSFLKVIRSNHHSKSLGAVRFIFQKKKIYFILSLEQLSAVLLSRVWFFLIQNFMFFQYHLR